MRSVNNSVETINAAATAIVSAETRVQPTTYSMAKGRVVCLYGGEDIKRIRKFTTTAKAVAEVAGINLELVYVGKNNAKERLKKNIATINAEQLSHYWLDMSSVSLFWARLESMLYSKLQKTVENDYIIQEVLS